MDNFIVSARKYRPDSFSAVVGQDSITTTLKNAIKNSHLGHAYLFCGPRGVGKTTCARIFAKTINCFNLGSDYEACNNCESCISFNETRAFNIHELDAASNNSVEDIRNLIDQVRIPPQVGKYSIYIIDEVHMLSAQAFNSFLKTLEEPPSHAIFILATTEKQKIIPTILSRCQIFDFNRIKNRDIVEYLEKIAKTESVEYELDALNVIASKADGAMRDALSIFDQIVSFAGHKITYEDVIGNLNVLDYEYYFTITESILHADIQQALLIFNEILGKGFDGHHFINGLSSHFRDLLVSRDEITLILLDIGAGIREKYLKQSHGCSVEFLTQALDICNSVDINYKSSRNQRLHVELGLIKLCSLNDSKKKTTDLTEAGPIKDQERDEQVTGKTVQDKPEENQSEGLNQTSPETVAAEEKQDSDKSSPAGKTSRSSRKFPSTGLSIKDTINGNNVVEIQDVDEDEETEEIPETKEDFSSGDLVSRWHEFAEGLKSEKPRMYNTLKSHLPLLEDNFHISVLFDNKVQQEDFTREIKHDLIIYLQRSLNNYSITLQSNVKEKDENKNKFYTAEEKFEHMSNKNPNLSKLKKDFNLDFE